MCARFGCGRKVWGNQNECREHHLATIEAASRRANEERRQMRRKAAGG
jgi:hypothetical protein